ncbi:tRNA pseudouridine(55) synthase TruB [Proteinivorax hydrogeniformans]|uniref:tRNA pseudouridine synthase B n=1 Tax=Proteinivorax hydrogeniformans TaxID=1826727 RepID=A0AAU8HNV4_9FIRM
MDGIINVLKPPGKTSHQVVAELRKKLGIKKIGHTGTLDPNAAGVLPICIGKATRVSQYVMDFDKVYRAEVTLGEKSDTGDLYGNVTKQELPKDFSLERNALTEILNGFVGEITQTPPMASAIKVKGKKLYEYYRQGKEVEVPTRKVQVYKIELIDTPFKQDKFYIDVTCSKGTYIRSLCTDIGDVVGYGGLMSFLLRTKVGPFNIETATPLSQIEKDKVPEMLFPLDTVLVKFPKLTLDDDSSQAIIHGRKVNIDTEVEGTVRLYNRQGDFLALANSARGSLKPTKVYA